ncbi:MAG: zf-HC2 domain-containing protein [Planctomycetia bacterium]|nr:zf-HC2 domain-containing protein [Planctomycetia bacterium]
MRCEELADLLLPLAYDELDGATAERCRRHLAGCEACRAELAAIEETRRLLDQVPKRQTQVDLAAVCLRLAREQRHQRLMLRYGLVGAAAAAMVAALLGVRLLSVDIEPGRMVVAWHEVERPATTVDHDRAIVGRDTDARPTQVVEQERGQSHPDLAVESPLVARARAAQTWPGRRDYLAVRDTALRWGLDALPVVTPADNSTSPTRSSTYSALRHEFLDEPQSPPDAEAPGA